MGGAAPSDDKHANIQLYRSDTNGASWVQVNDDSHQLAGASTITSDNRIYGRVYVVTGGRGVWAGLPRTAAKISKK